MMPKSAASMALEGADAQDICRGLEELIPKVDSGFILDRVDYLYRGGRCSGLEMLSATVLQIKPCIEVINGKMRVGKKYRGSFDRCLKRYVQDRFSDDHNINFGRVFITHPMCSERTVDMVKGLIKDYAEFEEIIEIHAGCTVSSHCGPNTLGIFYLNT